MRRKAGPMPSGPTRPESVRHGDVESRQARQDSEFSAVSSNVELRQVLLIQWKKAAMYLGKYVLPQTMERPAKEFSFVGASLALSLPRYTEHCSKSLELFHLSFIKSFEMTAHS